MDDIMSDPKTIPHIKDTEIEFDELLDVVRPPGLCDADEQFLKKGGLSDLPAATSVDNTLSRERAIFYSTHPYSEFRKSFEKRRMDHAPKTSILRQYLQKLQDTLGSRLPRAALVGVVATALLAVFVQWPPSNHNSTSSQTFRPNAQGIRPKGTVDTHATAVRPERRMVRLYANLHTPGIGRAVANGDLLREGDQLRLSYDSDGLSYILVVSVDDTGLVTPLYPDDGSRSMEIVPGMNVPLPGGIELDNFVGFERIFALFSTDPLRFDDVSYAVKQLYADPQKGKLDIGHIDQLPMSNEIAQASIWFQKIAE